VVGFPAGSRDLSVQTDPGEHPDFYLMGTSSKAAVV
jgi:hypothetical protein